MKNGRLRLQLALLQPGLCLVRGVRHPRAAVTVIIVAETNQGHEIGVMKGILDTSEYRKYSSELPDVLTFVMAGTVDGRAPLAGGDTSRFYALISSCKL